jgi:prevent-host-death family protein
MAIKIIPVSDLRRDTSKVVRSIQQGGDVVYITHHGRPTVVLVDYEEYEAMLAQLEDLSDLASLAAAEGEPERDYAEFLRELGQPSDDSR